MIIISILFVAYGKVKTFEYKSENPVLRFSVVIPFRNESRNLEAILNSIAKIDYPKELFEIILVDDASDDNSVEVIERFLKKDKRTEISIIKNKRHSNSPKKDAIETAISQARFEWIVTTDADCVVPNLWLQSFDAFLKGKSSKLVVAPVTFHTLKTQLGNFQLHDILSLQTATVGGFGIGKPFLCNGANLCYSKSTFIELQGFEGNNAIASGDDLFFMEKMVQVYPRDVHYLKSANAVVYSQPEITLKALFHQRVRWASKTSAYSSVFSKTLAFIVLLMNVLIVLGFIFALLGLVSWQFLLVLFSIKFSIDLLFIIRSSNFFG